MDMILGNTNDLLKDPKIREPWPKYFVDWTEPRDPKLIDDLAKVLNEAEDERPLQKFYEEHLYLLALAWNGW